MQQRTINSRNDSSHSVQQILRSMMLWILVVIMLLQQMTTTDAAKFKGDNCVSKNKAGSCKEWSECPVIKTLIESGEYTNREVVSCGFGIREELICCPNIRTETKIETTSDENIDRFTELTTTQAPVKDFWLDLLQTTSSSTTAAPDFWLHLLKSTTTTTTTLKPLIIGEQKLNENSEFYDFNALIGGNQNGGPKRESQKNPIDTRPNDTTSNRNSMASNTNGRGNLNTRPVNINQWNFEQPGSNFNSVPGSTSFNSGRGNNAHNNFPENNNANFGWGQQNFNRGQHMGRGQFNNNGRGNINGRGQHNNGRTRNSMDIGHQSTGFVFPNQNNMRPNNFFGEEDIQNHRPGRPVNNMQEQKPNIAFTNSANRNNNQHISNNEDQKIDDLIKNVFHTQTATTNADGNANTGPPVTNNQGKVNTMTIEDSIADIFHVNKPTTPAINPTQQVSTPQPVVSFRPQGNHNHHEVKYLEYEKPHHQMESINFQAPGHFELTPAVDSQINGNDLDGASSTSFIQQPVVVETWPGTTAHSADFDPVQIVYENLLHSGMDIVKAHDMPAENIFGQHQQFGEQPTQLIVVQPQQPAPQFVQQPEFIYQQPNVQSPPSNILNPLKPFEFRPPPEDGNNFFEDNNLLSTNSSSTKPDTKTSTDRPAIRACHRIERGLTPSLSPHILGGIPAELGEFPHMVAISYGRNDASDRSPYDVRCGGTLIDKRFVLTAAHCVNERDSLPSVVLLGVVNFTDANQMNAAIELRIKHTHIHDDYAPPLTYNDIAILELERDVEYSEYVYPVCLYTDERDPDTSIKLWVTGWGTVNTTTRSFSDVLLKAPLHTSPLVHCNKSFTDYGLNRRIPDGIIRSQFCAEDKDQLKDACQGDSGGPLHLIVDESYKKYRLVGVVSAGFSCASSAPGLYTRVAAFLDFIEKVVWPNGGD